MAGKKLKSGEAPKLARPKSLMEVTVSGSPENGQNVAIDKDDSLQTLFGTEHPQMAEALLGHCLRVLKNNEASDDHAGSDERMFMLTAVTEIKPRDTFERMLAVQMAATHVAVVRSARWLANTESVEQVKAHYSGYTKLSRAYVAQMEALRKHRNGGKQTVTVQHVNVAEGGQAIVGNV